MNGKYRNLVASVTFAALLYGPSLALAATSPTLGAAGTFSVLAALSMSAAGAGTSVSGDLGLSPGLASSKTGPWTVGGTQYFGPLSLASTAQGAALNAFINLAGQASSGTWAASPWSPVPGVWTAASDTTFAGTITLSGGYNDVWVFQVGRDMTFSGSVVLTGNAQPCNVFWQIGRSATIASGSTFVGTLIASEDVTLVSSGTVNGRIISLHSSLTTDGNRIITGPTCLAAPTTTPGGPTNTPGGPTNTPGGPTNTPGGPTNTPGGPTNTPGGPTNTPGGPTNTPGGPTATPTGTPGPPTPPTLSKRFSPAVINEMRDPTLTITLCNPNNSPANLIAPLTDTLPDGVVIAAPPNASTTCIGGVFTPPPSSGDTAVTLSAGAIIPASGCCTVTVNVIPTRLGHFVNTLPINALQTTINGEAANNTVPANATLTVRPFPIPMLSGRALIMLTALLALVAFAVMRKRAM